MMNQLTMNSTNLLVVGSILFATDELLRVIELAIDSTTDFITHCWLQIDAVVEKKKINDTVIVLAT
jgi:hypothetical protein